MLISFSYIPSDNKITSMNLQRGFDKRYCQDFQSQLAYQKIDSIWKSFREAGNSIEGRITKTNFKKIMNKYGFKNDKFLQKLFDRFKLDKYLQKAEKEKQKNDKQEEKVDLQDYIIGLAVLSRIPFLHKVKFIFYLTDLDEDGCLSLEEIQNMIERIQKIFCKENSSAKVDSSSLLFELAHKKAVRNFNQMLVLLKRNNKQLKNDEGGLITSDEFIQALKLSRDLYTEQKFIPLNLSLCEIMDNVASEPNIRISQNIKKTFIEFRQQLCTIMQNKSQKDPNAIKYPGRVQIIRNEEVVGSLPNTEKIVDKKLNKTTLKGKTNQLAAKLNYGDLRDGVEQKGTEQSLQTYKMKVKKMIETKQDPKLNVRFDQMYKKS